MKKIFYLIPAVLVLLCAYGCKYYSYGLDEFLYRSNTVDKRAAKLKIIDATEIPEAAENEPYDVLIITDVHFGGENRGNNRDRKDDEFLGWIRRNYEAEGKTLPRFCICLGDVAEHGLESEYRNFKVKLTDKLQSQFGIKTFNVIGNHDLYNAGWNYYEELMYPDTSFYKFRTDKFTWYFMDSASGSFGESQLTKYKRDMEYNERGRLKLVFTHIPAYAGGLFYYTMQNSVERDKFIAYSAENDVKVLVDGHTHKEITSDLGFTEYNLPGFLEKRGFGILTVDEAGGKVSCRTVYYSD